MTEFLSYKTKTYKNFEINEIKIDYLFDKDYLGFLKAGYDGFYFSNALHIYGTSSNIYHNVNSLNAFLKDEFAFINAQDWFCFGCDLFGNQFCFKEKEVALLNIETGRFENVARSFKEWLNIVISDINYLTGEQIIQE